ncbi:MAG: protease modulator HflC [Burkholderiales bacterium]|jgi:membrane protease subunit HflC|nr:protease modulator HflC [Burkholderiales bacterium]
MKPLTTLTAILIAILIVASQIIYVVDQRQYAIKFQFGEIISIQEAPGLSWKWPLIQNIRFFDKRNITLNSSSADRFQTSEKKPLLIDFVVLWRIVDVGQYYRSVTGDEEAAKKRIEQTVKDILSKEINKRTVSGVISTERYLITQAARDESSKITETMGVKIVDVRLRRVDYTTEVTNSVYERMQAERRRVANELRSTGAAKSERRRAEADRERQVKLAEAYRKAQEIKGKGDAEAAAIYAQAYNIDPEFYNFYRSLNAYQGSLQGKNDVLILDPTSDFFRYFKQYGRTR